MRRLPQGAEDLRTVIDRLLRVLAAAAEGRRCGSNAREVIARARPCGAARDGWLEDSERLPHIAHGDIVQEQRLAHPFGDRLPVGPADRHQLRAGPAPQQPAALELAQGFAHGGAVDAELACQLGLRRQPIALAQRAAEDPCADRRRHLAVGRLVQERRELDAQAAASKSSRPISMRRISWVPAPIS